MKKEVKTEQKLPCQPLGDRVLVELIMESKSAGGIDLPEKQVKFGFLRAIGLGVPDNYVSGKEGFAPPIKCGDKVFLPRGDTVGDKFKTDDGAIFLLIPITYIAAVMPPGCVTGIQS